MNILFISIGGIGDLSEGAVYPDLLRFFRNKGHKVSVVCQRERRFKHNTEIETEHGIQVLRVKTGNITKTNVFEKGMSTLLISYQFKRAIRKYFKNQKFDIILYSTPPITIDTTVSYVKKRDDSFSYLMLKDIFPQNALDIKVLSNYGLGGLLTKYFFHREKKLYLTSDIIGCMSAANTRFILDNNPYIDQNKVEICPNTIDPITKKGKDTNALREIFGLPQNKLIFVYGGNFGKPQNVDFIVEILKNSKKEFNCHFVMCGSGTEFYKIRNVAKIIDKSFVTIFDSLSKNEYNELLAACDVGLIFLDYRFTIPNFPSRILDYMNHSLPVLASTDSNTDIGKVIVEGDFGWWCENNSYNDFELIIKTILSSPYMIFEKGIKSRNYLEKHFTTNIAYERIINAYNMWLKQ